MSKPTQDEIDDEMERELMDWIPDPAKGFFVKGCPDELKAFYKEIDEVGADGVRARLRAEGHGDDQKGYVFVKPKETK